MRGCKLLLVKEPGDDPTDLLSDGWGLTDNARHVNQRMTDPRFSILELVTSTSALLTLVSRIRWNHMTWPASSDRTYTACHIIVRIIDPGSLNHMASYDVASDICQAL
jgi:hypothetical protein